MKTVLNCEGKTCEYYRKYYDTIRIGESSFMPNFSSTDERCVHPSQMEKIASERFIDRIGVRLITINKCPK